MTAERSFLLDELGDPAAPIGSKSWSLWVSNEIRKAVYDNEQSGTRLRRMVDLFKEHAGWQPLGFLTWEQFCESRLQKQPEDVEVTITLRMTTQARAEQPKELNGHAGRPTKNNSDNSKNYTADKAGNSADYLTARIARDRPDILDGMKTGKYRSVRAAAIDAGIVEPKQRYQLPTDPTAAGRYLAQRVDDAWMLELYDAYMKAQGKEV